MTQPLISMVIVVYNMQRAAPRTLQSITAAYQGVSPDTYEVIVVENGSDQPLSKEHVEAFGPNFHYFVFAPASPSPAGALNFGVQQAKGRMVGLLIDGARMLTPGVLSYAFRALNAYTNPVVSTLAWHLGPQLQRHSIKNGYSEQVEDHLLEQIDWPNDGYKLFAISTLAGSSLKGWFLPIRESNCLFLLRQTYAALGGFDERFDLPGGGLVNLDFYRRLCEQPTPELIVLLGEGSFHQIHGGVATNNADEQSLQANARRWGEQYQAIRGVNFKASTRQPDYWGHLPPGAMPFLDHSLETYAAELTAQPRPPAPSASAPASTKTSTTTPQPLQPLPNIRADAAPKPNTAAPPLAICTIISKNYLAQARCLAESFLKHHPGSQVFVLLVDHLDNYFDPAQEPFVTVLVEELNIPNFKSLAFGYTVTELNTAVKPFFLEYLFQHYALQQLCYFDPDILIYEPLTDLASKLDQFGIVLTPHLSGFLNDERTPNELHILVSGAYNLGFIGLARHPELETFLQWWQRKLLKYCVADIRQGLFVDQRWIDLVPSLFSSVHILRDPGYNVAYWNLHHRPVQPANGRYTVAGSSLKFFHFSGFMPENMETISKYQDRFTLKGLGAEKELFLDYRKQLIAHGYATVQQWPYAYRTFADGALVSDIFRQIYRAADSEGQRWPNPFAQAGENTFSHWLNQPADEKAASPRLLTNLAIEIYRQRPDLQAAFPDINGRDRLRFANWFVIDAQRQHLLDERFIQPIREAVDQSFASIPAATPETATPDIKPTLKPTFKPIPRLRSLIARRVMQLNASPVGRWSKQLLGQRLTSRLKFHFWNIFNPPPARTALPLPAQFAVEAQAPTPSGLNLVGYIHSETGVGEAARNTLRALRSHGYPAAYTNLKYELARQGDESCNDIPEGSPYAVNLIHANADQVPGVLKTIGSDFFADKYNIGFWFWELTSFPEIWREHAGVFNEIWVASSFTQATLAPLLPIPVVRMRPCIEVQPATGIDRQALGLPENKFVFLFTFDILSICERKNPWAVIEAYRQAFGSNSQEAVLMIKVNNLQRALGLEKALGLELGFETKLAQAVDTVSGILLEAHLDRGVVNALYHHCDCFVSLHRSEGFGLSLAESMYLGKPCIATGYSSNMDFMTPANSYLVDYQLVTLERDYGPYQAGSVWADPDVRSAAAHMRRVFENPEEAAQKGRLAAADIRQFYSAEATGREMIRRLELVAHPASK